jgi:hypothetical protein
MIYTLFMGVSLHLQASLAEVQNCLAPLLLADSNALLLQNQIWVSIYAEQLSEYISDIEELAVPLSSLAAVTAVIAETRSNEVYIFFKGALQSVSAQLPEDLPLESINDYETLIVLARAGMLSQTFVQLTRDADKPGLAEFFGRSSDE